MKDNIREWTGLELIKSQRAVENRGKWRKPVAKSPVVPTTHAVKGLMMMMINGQQLPPFSQWLGGVWC